MEKNPIVTITMENGDVMKAELYPQIAPMTVRNFISLINKGFYNGVGFHRIIKGFMIQGGDPEGNGTGGPGYCIKGEFTSNGFQNDLKHTPGVLSMARTMIPDSAGSQFFIMHETSPHLDGEYAAFGQVIEGMDVVDKIANVRTGWFGDAPVEPQIMKEVTVDTFGVKYEEPGKLPKSYPEHNRRSIIRHLRPSLAAVFTFCPCYSAYLGINLRSPFTAFSSLSCLFAHFTK